MFITHFLNHHQRLYLTTGDWEAPFNPIFPSPAEMLLGVVPEEIDIACNRIAKCGPNNPKQQDEIKKYLDALAAVDLNQASVLVQASVLAFRLKFGFFAVAASSVEEVESFLEFYGPHVTKCWQAYEAIFTFAANDLHPDLEFFPKHVSRFIHFFQSYQYNAEHTTRNRKHSERFGTLLSAALLKYVISIPAESLGRCYSGPKMVRELILTMVLMFPESKSLAETCVHVLAITYDYLNCLSFQEEKRGAVNSVFNGRRQVLDGIIEGTVKLLPEKLWKELSEANQLIIQNQQRTLIQDIARCGVANTFGRQTNRAYEESDILHIKLIVANETREGHIIVLLYRGHFRVKHIGGFPPDAASLVSDALSAAVGGDFGALVIWDKLAEILDLVSLGPEIAELTKGASSFRVFVYPDGYLWNVPWSYLLNRIWPSLNVTQEKEASDNTLLVAVKLGARNISTDLAATEAVFLAGWDYGKPRKATAKVRRGEVRGQKLESLLAAKEEVRSLSAIWNDPHRKSFVDLSCTASSVLNWVSRLDSPAILHLACHGSAFPGSISTLWLPDKKKGKYTALHYERALRVSWQKCDFVFLNACYGASGDPFVGGPSLGLHEALSVSGVQRMLAPLWPVEDETARDFAIAFYNELVDSRDYLQAFTLARRNSLLSSNRANLLSMAAYTFVLL